MLSIITNLISNLIMKKIDLQFILESKGGTLLGKEDLKYILGAGEGYDSIGGEDPGDDCLKGDQCGSDNDCENKFCTKCVKASSGSTGYCQTWG